MSLRLEMDSPLSNVFFLLIFLNLGFVYIGQIYEATGTCTICINSFHHVIYSLTLKVHIYVCVCVLEKVHHLFCMINVNINFFSIKRDTSKSEKYNLKSFKCFFFLDSVQRPLLFKCKTLL